MTRSHPDGPAVETTRRPVAGLVATGGYLVLVAVLSGFLSTRDLPVAYFAAAPAIAAATFDWQRTALVGWVAVLAALVTGSIRTGDPFGTSLLLPVGPVLAATIAAVVVARLRQGREVRLAQVTRVAEVAEDAIIRRGPLSLPDVECASVYRSATIGAKVGGDLYEGVAGPYGTRLIIGDARGKGLPAVQMAALVLGAFRHGALAEPDLEKLVLDLDRTAAAFCGEEDFVTALVVEVTDLDVRLISCGHPAPLIGPPGYVRQVPVDVGLPLGLGGERKVTQRRWPTRQILMAYTDGLVEARDPEGTMLPIEGLASVLQTDDPPVAIAEFVSALDDHVRGDLKDDLTILAIKRIE